MFVQLRHLAMQRQSVIRLRWGVKKLINNFTYARQEGNWTHSANIYLRAHTAATRCDAETLQGMRVAHEEIELFPQSL